MRSTHHHACPFEVLLSVVLRKSPVLDEGSHCLPVSAFLPFYLGEYRQCQILQYLRRCILEVIRYHEIYPVVTSLPFDLELPHLRELGSYGQISKLFSCLVEDEVQFFDSTHPCVPPFFSIWVFETREER